MTGLTRVKRPLQVPQHCGGSGGRSRHWAGPADAARASQAGGEWDKEQKRLLKTLEIVRLEKTEGLGRGAASGGRACAIAPRSR